MQMLNNIEIRRCYEFANEAWNNRSQSVQQFGTTEQRNRESFIADQVSGKLAELIFKKEIENKFESVKVHVDFKHYLDPLHTDNGDVSIENNGKNQSVRIDIKGSSYAAKWLLVEKHKYWELKTNKPMADRYVMVKFSNDMPTSKELRENPESILKLDKVSGQIVGWANHSDFISRKDNAPWFTFNRGERLISGKVLPKTAEKVNDMKHLNNYIKKVQESNAIENIHIGPPLDATLNVGLPIDWLNKDLNILLN